MVVLVSTHHRLRSSRPSSSLLVIAVLLALPALAPGCASAPTRREVKVDVLWVNDMAKIGGTSPALVSVEKNATGRIRVGVVEESALQLGDQWRASVWLAAFQASLVLDRSLSDWLMFVELDHHGRGMDGASAGALLTAAMLTGMTGERADPGFAMTGTINPDGTIGPVAGIPQKFQAAMALGKTRLGYPLGQHRDKDLTTGLDVELTSLGAASGTQIVEIPDIETAYHLMTGKSLPRPAPLDATAMAIPAEIETAQREQTKIWLGSAQQAYQDYTALRLQDPWLAGYWNDIDARFGDAAKRLESGQVPAAFQLAADLFIDADSALVYGQLLQYVRDGRYEDANVHVNGVLDNVDRRLGETVQRLKSELATSASDLMMLVNAFEAFGQAVRHFGAAVMLREAGTARMLEIIVGLRQNKLKLTPDLHAELMQLLHGPLAEVSQANVQNFLAGQHLQFRPPVKENAKTLSQRYIERLGDLLRIAGNANVSYFETLIIQPIAKDKNVSKEHVRANFRDPTYQLTLEGPRAMMESNLEDHFGSGTPALAMVRLSTALNTYVNASFLIAKYYSLESAIGDRGQIVKIGREEALQKMLIMAEQKARVHAARASAGGRDVPVAAKVAYQSGVAFQASPIPTQRLKALEQFWRASMMSQMAVLLSRP